MLYLCTDDLCKDAIYSYGTLIYVSYPDDSFAMGDITVTTTYGTTYDVVTLTTSVNSTGIADGVTLNISAGSILNPPSLEEFDDIAIYTTDKNGNIINYQDDFTIQTTDANTFTLSETYIKENYLAGDSDAVY